MNEDDMEVRGVFPYTSITDITYIMCIYILCIYYIIYIYTIYIYVKIASSLGIEHLDESLYSFTLRECRVDSPSFTTKLHDQTL